MKANNNIKNQRWAVLAAFFFNGALIASWIARIPAIQDTLALSEVRLGFVLMGMSVGMIASLLLSGNLIARHGSKTITIASGLAACLALPLLGLAPQGSTLFLLLAFFGAGISAMDVAMNEQAVLVERSHGKPIMSSFHAAFSIGGFFGAMLGAGMAAATGLPIWVHFVLVGLLVGASFLFLNKKLVPTVSNPSAPKAVFTIPRGAVWLLGIIALGSMIGEGASGDWSAVYLTDLLETNASTAALGFASFSLTMTVGRLIGDFLTDFLGPKTLVRLGGFTAGIGFLIVALTANVWIAILAFGLIGLGLANIIPIVFSAAGNLPDTLPGAGIAGAATIGYLGFLAGPPLIGSIAEIFSLRTSFIIISIIIGGTVLFAKHINK